MGQDLSLQKQKIRQLLFSSFSISVETAKSMLNRIESNPERIPSILRYLEKEMTTQYSWVKNTYDEESDFRELLELRITEWRKLIGDITIPEYMQMVKCWDVTTEWFRSLVITPSAIKQMLDCFMVGQENYKMMLSVTFYTYLIHKRENLPRFPKCNLVVCGPSGSGKTYGMQVLSKLFRIPFLVIHCNSLVQEGIMGTTLSESLTSLALEWSDYSLRYSIICFDEFDKLFEKNSTGEDAGHFNARIVNELLNIIDDKGEVEFKFGYDNNARRAKIPNDKMMFVFTGVFNGLTNSNIGGSKPSTPPRQIGFKPQNTPTTAAPKKPVLITPADLINFGVKPEIVGRVQNIVTIDALTEDDMIQLFDLGLSSPFTEFQEYFKHHEIDAVLTEDGMRTLARIAIQRDLGVRGMKSLLQQALMEDMFDLDVGVSRKLVVDTEYLLHQLGINN